MKDFDKERLEAAEKRKEGLAFTVGGVTLYAKAFIAPEAVNALTHEGHDDVVKMYDAWIAELIEPDDVAKWTKIRKDADPPLNIQDMENVVVWLIEVASGRPTEPPGRSSSGRTPSVATSKAPSPSPVPATA